MFAVTALVQPSAAGANAEGLRRDVAKLASAELAGRMTGSEGAAAAAEYLCRRLEALGARPLPGHDDYRLPFTFIAGTRDAGSSLTFETEGATTTWDEADHVQALAFSASDAITAPVVFAGYGLAVPEGEEVFYDSYAGLDVEGKIAVVLRYSPEDTEGDLRAQLARYSGLRYKALQARQRGAAALLVVTGPRSPNAGETVPLTFDAAVAGSGLVAASISGEAAGALFAAAGRDLESTQRSLDSGNPHVPGFDLGTEVTLEVAVEHEERTGHNVVGYLSGSGAAEADEPWVVLGAHFDHLGRGRSAQSLADASQVNAIHHGADDNASGVAAALEAARRLAAAGSHRRHVAIAFWSGEELGTLGSTAFLRERVLDPARIAAYVNFDMVGRMRDNKLTLQAVGSSPVWPGLIERTNVPVGFDVRLGEDPYLPTDSSVFNQADVPTLHFFTGSHEDYHKPSDTADKLNYEDLERVARFGALLVGRLADLETAPEFVAVAPTTRADAAGRDTVRAYTGTIPDYATEVDGLLLAGVIEGGPAAAAGLREGDVIVELGGTTVANIYDYTYALDAVKVGEPTKIVFVRDGERHETTIVPAVRE